MKNTLNIFSNKKLRGLLNSLLSNHQPFFFDLDEINTNIQNTQANIIFINNQKDLSHINFQSLTENYLLISSLKKNELHYHKNIKLILAPITIDSLNNIVKNFLQNLKLQFHDISIENEKLRNLNNNTSCYLTKIELEILIHLISEKETSKNFIKENILNIKSNIETNSLESHLTRIRKKMNKVKTDVKIQTRSEKLLITT